MKSKMVVENNNNIFLKKLFIVVIRFLVNYFRYTLLTVPVLFFVAMILFMIININPDFSFSFMRIFSFINPIYATDSYSMEEANIMEVFLFISFIFYIMGSFFKFFLKKFFDIEIDVTYKKKLYILIGIFSILYLINFVLIFYNGLECIFYLIFIVFYIINMFVLLMYVLFDYVLKFLIKFLNPENINFINLNKKN